MYDKRIKNNKFDYSCTLFVVSTPIGNLEDITLRALNVLKNVDLIACEDTRHTLKLLNHYNIKRKLISYHKYTKKAKEDNIVQLIEQGQNIALVSNAGVPAVSDPGHFLIKKVIDKKLNLVVLPGASSVITAGVYSGLNMDSFIFAGWMPKKPGLREKTINKYISLSDPVIFLESPHRILKTCKALAELLPEINIVLARELTKIHEQIFRGKIKECIEYFENKKIKGEIVIIIKEDRKKK
ncbi:16S rRNA (cytidine(1402)-2'-O)-methyltransferase [bacterium]